MLFKLTYKVLLAVIIIATNYCALGQYYGIKPPPSPQFGVKYEPGMRVLPEGTTVSPTLSGLKEIYSTVEDMHSRSLSKKYHGANSPYYNARNTAQQNQLANMSLIREQMANNPMYQPPSQNKQQSPQVDAGIDASDLIDEAKNENPLNTKQEDLEKTLASNKNALEYIQNQLNGLEELSLTEAYYQVESAYGEPYLTKEQYYSIINESVSFIQEWMNQNNLDPNNPEAVHKAIQQFIGTRQSIKIKKGTEEIVETNKTHLPFFYDFNDYSGEKDHRNYFVTKALATGTGQCNSLPAIYLILAEQLGVTAYLSFAPHHSFIVYPDANGELNNYETTSHSKLPDQWYKNYLQIKNEAVQSGIYLTPLNKKQIISNLAIDLANGYLKKNGLYDLEFINNCIEVGSSEFLKTNNIYAHLMQSAKLANLLRMNMEMNNIEDVSDIPKNSDTYKLHQKLMRNETYIKSLGYHKLPVNTYNKLIEEQDQKSKKQKEQNIETKEHRNLFSLKPLAHDEQQ